MTTMMMMMMMMWSWCDGDEEMLERETSVMIRQVDDGDSESLTCWQHLF